MSVAGRFRLNPEAREMGVRPVRLMFSTGGRHSFALGGLSRRIRQLSLGLMLSLLLMFATGCFFRHKNNQIPPQATAPSIAVPPTAQAGQQPAPPVQTTPPPASSAETGAIPQPSTNQAAKPKTKNHWHKNSSTSAKQSPPQPAAPPAVPQKAAIAGEPQVQIVAQAPQGTARNTEQLRQSTEENLRRVTRQLSDSEQAMLRQARNYIAQSRLAEQDGDLERAYNLAMKANLLSGELAK